SDAPGPPLVNGLYHLLSRTAELASSSLVVWAGMPAVSWADTGIAPPAASRLALSTVALAQPRTSLPLAPPPTLRAPRSVLAPCPLESAVVARVIVALTAAWSVAVTDTPAPPRTSVWPEFVV